MARVNAVIAMSEVRATATATSLDRFMAPPRPMNVDLSGP
jgi:hypothetical protein